MTNQTFTPSQVQGAAKDQRNAPPGAVARQLWILLGTEHDRDGYALKPQKWEGPGEYQCVEYPDGSTTLVKVHP